MEVAMRAVNTIKSLRSRLRSDGQETRLSAMRPPSEFFDPNRISRPTDLNTAVSRISYNTRYFSGNYGLIIAVLAVYALLTNPLLLISLGFLIGGFAAINKWAPEPMQVGEHVVTQKIPLHGTLCHRPSSPLVVLASRHILLARRGLGRAHPHACQSDRTRGGERVRERPRERVRFWLGVFYYDNTGSERR